MEISFCDRCGILMRPSAADLKADGTIAEGKTLLCVDCVAGKPLPIRTSSPRDSGRMPYALSPSASRILKAIQDSRPEKTKHAV